MHKHKPIPKALMVISLSDMADSLRLASITWWNVLHSRKAAEEQKAWG